MWQWKNHIDQKFMNRFRELPQMPTTALPRHHAAGLQEALGEKPMCGGCGAKVGRGALQAALQELPQLDRPDITPLPGDDAAVLLTGGVATGYDIGSLTQLHQRSRLDDAYRRCPRAG